jgi:hypothetical protein
MPLTPPPAVNYPNPLLFLPNSMLNAYNPPSEGAGSISAEIDWGTMGGAQHCVSFNPNSNPAKPNQISRIASIYVDNSECQADAVFIFTDTGLTITVPAFTGSVLAPVVTNSLSFFVEAAQAIDSDVTRFLVLNVNPPPFAISQPTLIQEAAVFNDIAPAAGATQIVAAGTDGTLRGLQVYYNLGATGGNWATWVLEDGNNNVLKGGQFADNAAASNTAVNAVGIDATGLDLPFVNGLKFVITIKAGAGFAANSGLAVNVDYITP